MFGFNIHFLYNGKNYNADVNCMEDDNELFTYEVRGITPFIQDFPDPFILIEEAPDSVTWNISEKFEELSGIIAKSVLA